ncbi:hypothetical protein ABPG72_006655 [Tetrahymena utriculariae]
MQKSIIIAAILLIGLASSLRIVPVPQNFQKGNFTFEVASVNSVEFQFKTSGKFSELSSVQQRILESQNELNLRKFKSIAHQLLDERLSKLQIDQPKNSLKGAHLVVNVFLNNTDTKYTNYDNFKVDEAYEISINQNLTNIEFKCHGYVSFLRAIETFIQILIQSHQKTHFAFDFLPLSIKDAPAFGHRGVMIDTSRHFLSLEIIKQTIRGLSISKFNVLHLHLTDSESFPFELFSYPEITAFGAYSLEEIYTQEELRELDAYAQTYGVILIPEIDSPAHTRSWSNPPNLQDIDACRDYPKEQWGLFCNEPPCGQLDVTLEKARNVSADIIVETANIFSSEFLHLGGDEPNIHCWESKTSIAEYMKANNISNYNQLQTFYREFQREVIEQNNLNKKRIFWLASNNVDVQTDDQAIMQFWGDLSEYSYMLKVNNPVILSTYTYLYLDCGLGNTFGDNSWCDPFKTWKRIYSFDVTAGNLISRERNLGSEAAIWTETSTTDDIVQKIFPRVITLSLNLWNPEAKLADIELVKHLVAIKDSIRLAGIPTGAVSSQYCELNVEHCFFEN